MYMHIVYTLTHDVYTLMHDVYTLTHDVQPLCYSEVGKELNRTEEFQLIVDSMEGELLKQIRTFAIYYCSK